MHVTERKPRVEPYRLSRRTALVLLVLLIGLYGVGLGFSRLPLELFDESRQAVNAAEMRQTGLSLVTTYDFKPDLWNTKPPLLIWLLVGSMRVFGATLFAIRLPSLLASVATVAVVARACWKTTHRPFVALAAAVLLMASPLFFLPHVAMTADYDATLTLLLTVASLAFFRAAHAAGPVAHRAWIVCGLALGAAVLTKGIAGLLVLPGLFVYLAVVRRWGRVLRTPAFWIAVATTLLVVVGFYALRERTHPGYLSAVLGNEVTGRYGTAIEGHSGKPWYYLHVLGSGAFSLGPLFVLAPFALRGASPRVRLLGLFVTALGFTLLLIYSVASTKIYWYAAPTLPMFSILSALAVDNLLTRRDEDPRRRRAVAAVTALVLAFVTLRATKLIVEYVRMPETERLTAKGEGYRILFERLEALHPTHVTFVDGAPYSPEYRFYTLLRPIPGTTMTLAPGLDAVPRSTGSIAATCDPNLVEALVRAGRPIEATSQWAIVRID